MGEMSEELIAFIGGEPPSGYEAEMMQWSAAAALWAKVQPRLATQRKIPTQ